MNLTLVALKTILFATGFVSLWAWLALSLRRYDPALGGPLPPWTHPPSFLVMTLGAAIVAWCIGTFVTRGRGTPAPFDPPRRMVAVGPYRIIRNPMYVGGALLLLGFGLYHRSPAMTLFVPLWWLACHLLVVLYEEPTLRRKFGDDYTNYQRQTPRWLPL